MSDSPLPSSQDVLTGALAGRYDVLSLLGAGGMGQVYLGRDLLLDRLVAIKVLSPDIAASPLARERFLREARTVAQLRHPHIVSVHDAGDAGGQLYFVMEYVEGDNLRQHIAGAGSEAAESIAGRVRWLVDLCDALAYAHGRGVVHRDIKPENILVEHGSRRVLLTDFGVARAFTDSGASDAPVVTRTGIVVGSPRYMSPEQAFGERSVDGRSDIYSLGLTAFELLSGAGPFAGTSAIASLGRQLTERPPALHEIRPEVPPPLSRAIARALEPDPDARWQSAAEFRDTLAESLRPGAGTTTRTPSRRRTIERAIGTGAAAVCLVAVAVLGWRWHDRSTLDPRRSYLVAPFEILGDDRGIGWLREGSASMLSFALSQWTDLSVISYERSLDLLREAHLDSSRPVSLAEARDMARKAGVGTVVMGQVAVVRDSLSIVARLYDVETGKRLEQAEQTGGSTADPRPLFDAMTRRLLDIAGAPATVAVGRLTETTTSSLGAYRAYLDGTRALKRWELRRADSLFALATNLDSTFALAFYRRALVRGWFHSASGNQEAFSTRAVALSGRLPEHEQSLLRGYEALLHALSASASGNAPRADSLFRTAQAAYELTLARDSGDAEVWYGLGDALWHHTPDGWGSRNTVRGWSHALQAFNHTLALDSTFYLAYAHKLDIYRVVTRGRYDILLEGDSLRVIDSATFQRSLATFTQTARERALAAGERDAHAWLRSAPTELAVLSLSYLYRDVDRTDSARAVLKRWYADPAVRTARIGRNLAPLELERHPQDALAIFHETLVPADSEADAAMGASDALELMLYAGRVPAVLGRLGDVDSVSARTRALIRNFALRTGNGSTTDPRVEWWRLGVRVAAGVPIQSIEGPLRASLATFSALPATPAGAYMRGQAVGGLYVLYLATRRPADLALVRAWQPGTFPFTELDALDALEAGDVDRARRLAAQFPRPDSLRAAGIGLAIPRWIARADVYERLGDPARALACYEIVDLDRARSMGQADPSFPLYARSYLWRGRLYERTGDRPAALGAYRRFLEYWSDADPALEPQRLEARTAIARLSR